MAKTKEINWFKKNWINFFILVVAFYSIVSIIFFTLPMPVIYSIWDIDHQDDFTEFSEVTYKNHKDVVQLSTSNSAQPDDYIMISKEIIQSSGKLEFWIYLDFSPNLQNNPRVGFRESYIYFSDGKPYFRDVDAQFTKLLDENVTNSWINFKLIWDNPNSLDIFIDNNYTKTVKIKGMDFISFMLFGDGINSLSAYLHYVKLSQDPMEMPIYPMWEIDHQDNYMEFTTVNFKNHTNVLKLSSTNSSQSMDFIRISRFIYQASGTVEFWMYADFSMKSMANPRVGFKDCYIYLYNGKTHFRDVDATFGILLDENVTNSWVNFKLIWDSQDSLDIYIDDIYTKTVKIKELNRISLTLYADGINNFNLYFDYVE